MPVTLDPTVGGPTANTYANATEFGAFVDAHLLDPNYGNPSSDTINRALVQACRLIDSSFRWNGAANIMGFPTMIRAWPRLNMVDRNSVPIDPTTIPSALKDAQCEFARQLIVAGDKSDDNDALKNNITSIRAGSLGLNFLVPGQGSGSVPLRNADVIRQSPDFDYLWKAIPDAVRNLLPPSWWNTSLVSQPLIFSGIR